MPAAPFFTPRLARILAYGLLFVVAASLVLFSERWAATHGPPVPAEAPYADTVFEAQVDSVDRTGTRPVPTTGAKQEFQILTVHVAAGARAGLQLSVENDTAIMLAAGDRFYLHRAVVQGVEHWTVGEPDRAPAFALLAALFVLATLAVAGISGLRSLVALGGSFALILFSMAPLLYAGAPPVPVALGLSVFILAFSMFVTHGIDARTGVAFLSSMLALAVSAGIAEAAVSLARVSGFVSDETVYLNLATNGALDLPGLLLAGVLVGIVGILNDISVSQVHTVAEIAEADAALSRRSVWSRAQRVGKEHAAAVVTMLPLAYAGAALPLLMLFADSQAPLLFIANREMFAAEIIRTLSGGIGLLLAGAIATGLAVIFLVPGRRRV